MSKTINLKEFNYIVLEATNNYYKLRKFLKSKNYFVLKEELIKEKNHYNFIFLVKKIKWKRSNIKNKKDLYIGPILKKENSLIVKEFLAWKINSLNKIGKYNNKTKKELNVYLKAKKRLKK